MCKLGVAVGLVLAMYGCTIHFAGANIQFLIQW